MDAKSILAVGVGLIASFAALFLVIFGCISGNGGWVTVGIGILGTELGTIVTYFFDQKQITVLKNQINKPSV